MKNNQKDWKKLKYSQKVVQELENHNFLYRWIKKALTFRVKSINQQKLNQKVENCTPK